MEIQAFLLAVLQSLLRTTHNKVCSINIDDVEVLTSIKDQFTASFTAFFTLVPPPSTVTSNIFSVKDHNNYVALGTLLPPIDSFVRQKWGVGISSKFTKHLVYPVLRMHSCHLPLS